jgi:hypothetical protein
MLQVEMEALGEEWYAFLLNNIVKYEESGPSIESFAVLIIRIFVVNKQKLLSTLNRDEKFESKIENGVFSFFSALKPLEIDDFFHKTIPSILSFSKSFPKAFHDMQIPKFLKQKTSSKISISRFQNLVLLAQMVLCSFTNHRNRAFPKGNLSALWAVGYDKQEAAKIRCILHIFDKFSIEGSI